MTEIRRVALSWKSIATIEGAGVHLRRAFGFDSPERTDPFLLFDDFRSDQPSRYQAGFPWHPHRGIDTITYMLKGEVEHGDSLGNRGVIGGGDVQWMTAGSGIIHQEMPRGDVNGAMHGFQLWLNLPREEKMCHPRYRTITADEVPEVPLPGGGTARIISGRVADRVGPVTGISTDPQYLDITLPPQGTLCHHLPGDYCAMAYVIAGSGSFGDDDGRLHDNTTLLLFGEGDHVTAAAGPSGLRLLLIGGRPLRQPIAWRGPIVMNSEEELDLAFRQYREGTFLSHRPPEGG